MKSRDAINRVSYSECVANIFLIGINLNPFDLKITSPLSPRIRRGERREVFSCLVVKFFYTFNWVTAILPEKQTSTSLPGMRERS